MESGIMKKTMISLWLLCAVVGSMMAADIKTLQVTDGDKNLTLIPYGDINNVKFANDSMFVSTKYTDIAFPCKNIVTLTQKNVDDVMTVKVDYDGETARFVNPLAHRGVTVSTKGACVTIDNTNTTDEISVQLSGKSECGNYVYNGSYKTTLVLNGVDLTSTQGAAIDIECGKRIAVVLADGTENSLTDCEGGKQKAAMYFKGHPEFEGSGTLNVTGKTKHTISAKEYVQFKKSVGEVNILSSASDGIHAGQYFQMNGGVLTMSNLLGDGVQAEYTDDPEDENNGQIIIKGGMINITCDADDVDCLKADDNITISGGTLTLTSNGAAAKCIKSKGSVAISNAELTLTNTGSVIIEEGDPSYPTAIKADGNITVESGTIVIKNSAQGGKGMSADGDVMITGGTINATCSGDGAIYDPTPSDGADTYRVYVTVAQGMNPGGEPGDFPGGTPPDGEPGEIPGETPPSDQPGGFPGGGGPGGGGGQPGGEQQYGAWNTIYLFKEDGTRIGTLSSGATADNVQFYYYDFGKATEGTFYFAAPDFTDMGMQDTTGEPYAIKSGTFSGPTDGKAHFYSISAEFTTAENVRTYTLTDVTETYQGSTLTFSADESYSAAGIKADGNVTIIGGEVAITSSGKGGKGINIDGTLTIGEAGSEGPILNIATTGSYISKTGYGMQSDIIGSPKAIKVLGNIVINSGNVTTSTKSDGGEGIESKASITINGGTVVCDTYDDAINAGNKITVNDGIVWAHSTGNDGIDCNGRAGLEFNGGVVLSSGTNAPEGSFDCDQNNFTITGGTLIGTGGDASRVTSNTQPYATVSNQKITSNTYLCLQKTDGTVICAYKVPNAYNSAKVLVSSPEFVSGTSYNLVRNVTSVTNAEESYFDGKFLVGGTISGGTTTTISPR